MLPYYFTASAEKEIGRLPKKFQRQVFQDIESMCALAHPSKHSDVLKLKGYNIPTYRLRSGEYRVVFRVIEHAIIIQSVRNRQAGY